MKHPDLYGAGAVAQSVGCALVTSRLLMLELRARGVPGIYLADNGCHLTDRQGLRACAVEFANRVEPRQRNKRGGIVSR